MQNALSETQKQVQMSLESRKFRRKWERRTRRTSTGKSRDHETTKRHHGYQRIPSVFKNAQKPYYYGSKNLSRVRPVRPLD